MKVDLYIDSLNVSITTRDPELLAKWLLEQFATIEWTPATYVRAQVWPTFEFKQGQPSRTDWLVDSRFLGRQWVVKSPHEFVDALRVALLDAEGKV